MRLLSTLPTQPPKFGTLNDLKAGSGPADDDDEEEQKFFVGGVGRGGGGSGQVLILFEMLIFIVTERTLLARAPLRCVLATTWQRAPPHTVLATAAITLRPDPPPKRWWGLAPFV